jgi:hypothetical protein
MSPALASATFVLIHALEEVLAALGPPKKSKFAIRPARQNRCAPFLLLPQRKPTRYLLETQREAMKQKTDVQQRTLGLALRES